MKRFLLLKCLLLCVLSVFADNTEWLNFASGKNGTVVQSIRFENNGRLTFAADAMHYQDKGKSMNISYEGGKYMFFSANAPTPEEVTIEASVVGWNPVNETDTHFYIGHEYDFFYNVTTSGSWEGEFFLLLIDENFEYMVGRSDFYTMSFAGAQTKEQAFRLKLSEELPEANYYIALAYFHDDTWDFCSGASGFTATTAPNTPDNPNPDDPPVTSTDKLIMADVIGRSGSSVVLPMELLNQQTISGFQFNLKLPQGVTLDDAAMAERGSKLSPSFFLSDGVYKFSVMSMTGKTVTGNEGTVMNLTLNIGESVAEGDYTITLSDIMLFTESGDEIQAQDASAVLTIKNVLLGDVNGNGTVNTNDAIAIVNYVIGKPQAVFIEAAADVNGNGSINTNDAIAIVNYVIGKTQTLGIKERPTIKAKAHRGVLTEKEIPASVTIECHNSSYPHKGIYIINK